MPDRALDVFQRMGEIFGCEPGVRSYNTLLNVFVEAKQWDKVESLFAYFETTGLAATLQTYNVLIKMSCKRKQFEKARGFLDWMWKEGLKPDVFSYSTVISDLAKAGKVDDALQLFDEMSERGLAPDVTCYNILIDGSLKERDHIMAMKTNCWWTLLFILMLRLTTLWLVCQRKPSRGEGHRPDHLAFVTVINTYISLCTSIVWGDAKPRCGRVECNDSRAWQKRMWHNHLNPDINKDAWTSEEEVALMNAHRIYGNK
ncbi:PREDICTED: pentatricopeptide repeat-containing protein At3g09060-like [Camelina sativa]|uniref:Pentatricopeptide repeat-containing protein At3g09060-like n=1 Tax=Camelina sativa TaxID=90675 RepID=A0ABM0XR99_CAMSA|nr:PREDICTED: pentatricopeptide repeat-containing protein At3g09060-like [Camelina sativa]